MAGYRRRGRCSAKMAIRAAVEIDDRRFQSARSCPTLHLTNCTMKHILLPTDFSGTSVKAAYFAMDLYGAEDARYTLLNTYLKPAHARPQLRLRASESPC